MVAGSEGLPLVAHRDLLGLDVVGNVLGDGELIERHPPGEEHIHENQGLVVGRANEDVVRRVIGAVVIKMQPLAPHAQHEVVFERHRRGWPGRVIVAQQQFAAETVADAHHVRAEQEGCPDVIGV